ncbi:MAG: family 20 glycosylhydrolase, partial [Flavobacteriales bacterium]
MKMRRIWAVACICFSFLPSSAQFNVIPEPDEWNVGTAQFAITEKTVIVSNNSARPEADFLASWLSEAAGREFRVVEMNEMPAENFILINASKKSSEVSEDRLKSLPDSLRKKVLQSDRSRYRMNVTAKGILINAEFDEGAFYGVQTLRQLLPVSAEQHALKLPYVLPTMLINDGAHFPHRGLLLDCCRHFMSVDFIKKYIDALAYYKMNVLHWHLTEDQGWRIQIDKYPLLTEVGAWRTEKDGTRYGGFYSKQEIRDIVAYAAAHHVTIIPEIELPGHSSAAIAAYPALSCKHQKIEVENEWGVFKDIYCAGDEYTFEFLENVLTEVCELFPSAYIHIGGDEAPKFRWEQCEKCQRRLKQKKLKTEAELQTYFIERIAAFLATKGKRIIGWDEILEGGIPADAMIQSWRGMEGGEHAAKAHHDVVMSPTSHCYFDYGLNATDLEEVYNFDPIPNSLSTAETRYIRGGECNMWTEHAPQEKVDGKVFPRMLALAEVLWTYPQQRNYGTFYTRVESHYARLSALNIQSGFPKIPVNMKLNQKQEELVIELKPAFETVSIRYALAPLGPRPGDKYIPYVNPIVLNRPTQLSVLAYAGGNYYNDPLQWWFEPHRALGDSLRLSYEPSPYYPGGGANALVDGRLGSTNFRDGAWQAVQGMDMEAVIDLGENIEVKEMETHWFMYGNAWIFLPQSVEYFVSGDGKNWKSVGAITPSTDERKEGEFFEPLLLKIQEKTHYVKMIA